MSHQRQHHRFGREFHEKVARMTIVGPKKWEERLANLASPFYAQEAAYFEDQDAAWPGSGVDGCGGSRGHVSPVARYR